MIPRTKKLRSLVVRAAAGACALGCGSAPVDETPHGWLADVEDSLPQKASDLGVFRDPARLDAAPALLEFEPRWPLWSNGADKRRLLHVPPGASIDGSDEEGSWDFPIGTVFVKTFGTSRSGELAPIETRLIFRQEERWNYAVYLWNDERTDADLLEGNVAGTWAEQDIETADGAPYLVPSRLDCRTCHETSQARTGSPVLGLSPYQLTSALEDSHVFEAPPSAVEVRGRSDAETEALGYFIGNCVSCHNGETAENAAFSLYPEDAVKNTVGVETEGDAAPGTRVVAGDTGASVLYEAVVEAPEADYAGPFKQMPPLAVNRPDPAARELLEAWIESL